MHTKFGTARYNNMINLMYLASVSCSSMKDYDRSA